MLFRLGEIDYNHKVTLSLFRKMFWLLSYLYQKTDYLSYIGDLNLF